MGVVGVGHYINKCELACIIFREIFYSTKHGVRPSLSAPKQSPPPHPPTPPPTHCLT